MVILMPLFVCAVRDRSGFRLKSKPKLKPPKPVGGLSFVWNQRRSLSTSLISNRVLLTRG